MQPQQGCAGMRASCCGHQVAGSREQRQNRGFLHSAGDGVELGSQSHPAAPEERPHGMVTNAVMAAAAHGQVIGQQGVHPMQC
jgi:hypothetical protein